MCCAGGHWECTQHAYRFCTCATLGHPGVPKEDLETEWEVL